MGNLLTVNLFINLHFCRFTDQSWLMMLVYVGLAVLFTYLALAESDGIGLFFSFVLAVLSPLSMDIYFHNAPDPFWFCDFDKINWILALIGLFFGWLMMAAMAGLAIGFIKNIRFLFSNPIWAIISVILSVLWFGATLNGVAAFFDNHPFLGFLMIIGLLPTSKTPTIYVEGVGHVTGHGYNGGSSFHGDDGNDYKYDGNKWH